MQGLETDTRPRDQGQGDLTESGIRTGGPQAAHIARCMGPARSRSRLLQPRLLQPRVRSDRLRMRLPPSDPSPPPGYRVGARPPLERSSSPGRPWARPHPRRCRPVPGFRGCEWRRLGRAGRGQQPHEPPGRRGEPGSLRLPSREPRGCAQTGDPRNRGTNAPAARRERGLARVTSEGGSGRGLGPRALGKPRHRPHSAPSPCSQSRVPGGDEMI